MKRSSGNKGFFLGESTQSADIPIRNKEKNCSKSGAGDRCDDDDADCDLLSHVTRPLPSPGGFHFDVEPSVLAQLLQSRAKKLLIVDCRCFVDYNNSHIQRAINAFYSKLVRRRLQENKVSRSCLLQQLSSNGSGLLSDLPSPDDSEGPVSVEDRIDVVLYDHNQPLLTGANGGGADVNNPCNNRNGKPLEHPLPEQSCSAPALMMSKLACGDNYQQINQSCIAMAKRKMSACAPKKSAEMANGAIFYKALVDKLSNLDCFKDVLLLKGGFLDFQARYPDLCEGSAAPGHTVVWGPVSLTQSQPSTAMAAGLPLAQALNPANPARVGRPPLGSVSQPCLPPSSEGPTKILPFMYLGSQQDAMNSETMQAFKINHVVNLSLSCPRPECVAQENHFLRIPVNDNYQEKLLPYFDTAFEFLDKVRDSNSTVLIHCLAGISRSPTLAIAYIMRQFKCTTEEAYQYVKNRRPSISPNFNFMGQLLEYERQLKEQQTKDMAEKLKPHRSPAASPHHRALPSGARTASPGGQVVSDSEMLTMGVGGRGLKQFDWALSPATLRNYDAEDNNNAAWDDPMFPEQMRRCLSCPAAKIKKSASSSELCRLEDEMQEVSKAIKNANGKREMVQRRALQNQADAVKQRSHTSRDSAYSSDSHSSREETMMDLSTSIDKRDSTIYKIEEHGSREVSPEKTTQASQTPRPNSWKGLQKKSTLEAPDCSVSRTCDLPSPSTELQTKLTFSSTSSTICHAESITSACCPGSAQPMDSPYAEKVVLPGEPRHSIPGASASSAHNAPCTKTTVFASNPFFAGYTAQQKTLSEHHPTCSALPVVEQPRSAIHPSSLENPFFPSTLSKTDIGPSSSSHSGGGGGGGPSTSSHNAHLNAATSSTHHNEQHQQRPADVHSDSGDLSSPDVAGPSSARCPSSDEPKHHNPFAKFTHFFRRAPWSATTSATTLASNSVMGRSSTISSSLSQAIRPSIGLASNFHYITRESQAAPAPSTELRPVPNSQSAHCMDVESPESGFAESPVKDAGAGSGGHGGHCSDTESAAGTADGSLRRACKNNRGEQDRESMGSSSSLEITVP